MTQANRRLQRRLCIPVRDDAGIAGEVAPSGASKDDSDSAWIWVLVSLGVLIVLGVLHDREDERTHASNA